MVKQSESLSTRVCRVYDPGLIDYQEALSFQERLAEGRVAGRSDDAFILLEHPPVYTVGKSGGVENILVPREILLQEGISVYYVRRGGDITYHGPGQLVGYPIINLRENGLDVHQYVWSLEEVIIQSLADLGISGQRLSELPNFRGVWAGDEKVCAVGIQVTRGVTMHGFALNVNPNLRHFEYINPCGITGKSVTSVSKLLGHEVDMETVKEKVLRHFAQVFKFKLVKREALIDG